MEKLFMLAGLSMCAHILCSLILLVTLHNDPLAKELLTLPNSWLGPSPSWLSIRLLRAKFLLPWVPTPVALSEFSYTIRAVFYISRVSGAAFPLAILAFLVAAFVTASR